MERALEMDDFLRRLSRAECRAHCMLSAIGVLAPAPPDLWARAHEADALLPDLFGPEWELLALLIDACGEVPGETLQRVQLCVMWRYYRNPRAQELFGQPGSEERLTDWTRRRLGDPRLRSVREVEAEVFRVYEEIWDAVVRRAAEPEPARDRGSSAAGRGMQTRRLQLVN
jgi:hypothetical protein